MDGNEGCRLCTQARAGETDGLKSKRKGKAYLIHAEISFRANKDKGIFIRVQGI